MKVVAVVRSNGERTKEASVRLLRKQMAAECIEVAPFTDAVQRCFEIALDAKADWLLAVDADVLVFPGAVDRFVSRAREASKKTFHFQGVIRDKLSGKLRPAGHRMYRVKYLERMIPLIEDAVRVEGDLIRKFCATGVVSLKLQDVFGLHDYEQWYRDIYRKASVHAVKHSWWITKHWQRGDLDHQAAYAGWHGLPWDAPEKLPLAEDFDLSANHRVLPAAEHRAASGA